MTPIFCISHTSKSLSDCSKKINETYRLCNFHANVLESRRYLNTTLYGTVSDQDVSPSANFIYIVEGLLLGVQDTAKRTTIEDKRTKERGKQGR